MGVDIHVRIVKYNTETNFYHDLSLYRLRESDEKVEKYDDQGNPIYATSPFKRISPYDARNSEMFDIMMNSDSSVGFPSTSIVLNSLEPELRAEIEEEIKEIGVYGFQEISFSDLENYLHSHPTIVDYDAEEWETWNPGDPKPQKENPIKDFFESCISYATFAEKYTWIINPYSYYKILYWFDR